MRRRTGVVNELTDPDVLDWLLEPNYPAVRYHALTQLAGVSPGSGEAVQARQGLGRHDPLRESLDRLAADGRCTVIDLMLLSAHGACRAEKAVDRACQGLLDTPPRTIQDCYAGYHIGGLIRMGYWPDPRLRGMLRSLLTGQRFYDGNRPGTWLRYGSRGSCAGSHSCFCAVARALWAVMGIPLADRPAGANRFLREGSAFLASHRLYQANHSGFKPIRADWLRLHLPFGLAWRTDVMDLLDIATQIGLAGKASTYEALRWLWGKRDASGRWPLEHRFRDDRTACAGPLWKAETVGKPSKWVTLWALVQLKRSGEAARRLAAGELPAQEPQKPRQSRFSPYKPSYRKADEQAVRQRWRTFGMQDVLHDLVEFAARHGLKTGWDLGFVMGPKSCREWLSAHVRWIPRKGDKRSWPVCRLFFMAPEGRFNLSDLSSRLGIPLEDEQEKANFHKFFWRSLWRIRKAEWKYGLEEIAVTLRDPLEFRTLGAILDETLEAMASGRAW